MKQSSLQPHDVNLTHVKVSKSDTMLFDNSQEWLTAQEAADFLRIPLGSLRNMTCNYTIPSYRLGRRVRYKKNELRNLLSKKGDSYGN